MEEITGKIKNMTFWRVMFPMLSLVTVNTLMAPINTFISSNVSSSAVESIGTAGTILMLFSVLLSLLTGGSTVVMGQYIGKKLSSQKIKNVVDSTFFVTLIQAIIIIAFILPMSTQFLHWWGVKKDSLQMRDGRIYILLIAPTFLLVSLQGYFLSTVSIYGHPKWSMIIGILTTLLDATLSVMFVLLGKMGIMGVILGTIIARFVGLFLSMIIYSQLVQRFWKIRNFEWDSIKKIVGISLPIAGEKINYNLGQFVQGILIGQLAFQVGLNIYGHNYMLWSRAIFGSIQSIVLIAGIAFGIGLEQIVSRTLGENDLESARKFVAKAFIWSIIIDVSICIIVFFLNGLIVATLASKEENKDAIKLLQKQLYWSFLVLIFLEIGRCANLIYISACRSAGDSRYTAIISIPVTWVGQILIVWILVQYANMGWLGVSIGLALDECVRGVINYFRWKSNKWIKYMDKMHVFTKETHNIQ